VDNEQSLLIENRQQQQMRLELSTHLVKQIVEKNFLTSLSDLTPIALDREDYAATLDNVRMYKIDEIVYTKNENTFQKLTNVFNALAIHKSSVFLLIDGEKDHVNLYLGVRQVDQQNSIVTTAETLRKAMHGQFPGTRLKNLVNPQIRKIQGKLEQYQSIAIASGIPELKDETVSENEHFIQGMEKFIDTMQGEVYQGVILAENLTEDEVIETRTQYENIYSRLSVMRKATVNIGQGTSTVGIYGHGIIDLNSDVLRLGIKQRDYELNLLDNGAVPMSVIESDESLSPKKIDAVSAAWSKAYTTVRNAGRTVLLEKGLHYKQAALSPDKLQLTEGKASLLSDVSRILNIPESILNSQANKYASNEQNNEFYLQYCLAPILIIIEQSLDKMLLTEQEKSQGLFFKFDVAGFTKVNFENTVKNATNAFNSGAITNVEFRRIVGAPVNPQVEDYEYTKFTTGQVMFNVKNGVITNPNTQQNMNINTGEVTGNNASSADSNPVQQQNDGNESPTGTDSISANNSDNEEGENNDQSN